MSAGRAAAVAIAAVLAGAACRRKPPDVAPLPDSFARLELSAGAGPAANTAPSPPPDPFMQRVVPAELGALIAAAHGHPAVASLEAAGCDFALVMTGAAYDRFVELGFETKMPSQVDDPMSPVVYCASRTDTPPPDCAALAPIFARVAQPKRKFRVFSSMGPPPVSPRCSGLHDPKGKTLSGEGSGYGSGRRRQ